jgi:purine-binding chemotaxis protein CheW
MAQVGQFATIGSSEVADTGRCLVFRAGDLLAAVRLQDVVETLRPLAARPLAGTQPFVLGLSIMRGRPTPVVDVALLLTGSAVPASRWIAVRTPRGPIALATGEVLGLRATEDITQQNTAVLGPTPARVVEAIGSLDREPMFLLRSFALVPDDVWAAVETAGPAGPVPG